MGSCSQFTRWLCSSLQLASHPSRLVVLPSSHCSVPPRLPSPHTTLWQAASQVPLFGGSQVSPAEVSMKPSPQVEALHCEPRQMLPPLQPVPSASGVPALHFLPLCPPTVIGSQVSAPLHALPSLQAAELAQEKVQLLSQPVCGPLPLPKSHCSPVSTTPLARCTHPSYRPGWSRRWCLPWRYR